MKGMPFTIISGCYQLSVVPCINVSFFFCFFKLFSVSLQNDSHYYIMSNEKEYDLLNKIQSPADLRKLSLEELPELCKQLRKDIIEEVAVNPGHLASSLGATEITVPAIMSSILQRIVWCGM